MKLTRALIAIFVAVIASMALLTGCEEILEPGDPCEVDADCDTVDTVCFDQVCTALCEEDGDCVGDEVCEARPDEDDKVCQLDDDNGPPPEECESNEECPGDEICVDNECIDTQEDDIYTTVLIEDVTGFNAPERCDDETPVGGEWHDTAGIKLMWVELYDDGGSFVEYGHYHDYDYGDNANFGAVPSVFDGTPPDLDADMCPAHDSETGGNFYEDALVAMGCDGWVTIQFLDQNDAPMRLLDGDRVDIGEYGPQCNPEGTTYQSADEYYDVSLCTNELGSVPTLADLNEHCDVNVATDVSGFTSHDVSF